MARLSRKFKAFLSDESGAVTVDWVVLTALLVGLATPIGVNYVDQLTGATEAVRDGISAQTSLLP